MKAGRIIGSVLAALACIGIAGCGKQDAVLLKDAAPENSAMCFYKFDGKETTVKWLYDQAAEQEIIKKINKLPVKSADPEVLGSWSEPCYGIEISDKEGYEIWLTYSDGIWLTKDGSVYTADFDLGGQYARLEGEEDTLSQGGMAMPNAAILAKYSEKYYGTVDPEKVNDGLRLTFVKMEGPVVTVKLENLSDEPYIYGTYYSLQKEIGGTWYQMAPALSNYGFNDIAYELPAGGSSEEECDLTMYGELEAGHYRIEKELAYAEFDITE